MFKDILDIDIDKQPLEPLQGFDLEVADRCKNLSVEETQSILLFFAAFISVVDQIANESPKHEYYVRFRNVLSHIENKFDSLFIDFFKRDTKEMNEEVSRFKELQKQEKEQNIRYN